MIVSHHDLTQTQTMLTADWSQQQMCNKWQKWTTNFLQWK